MAQHPDQRSEVESSLRHIADDRAASLSDRTLARDILAILPELQHLSERGFGELFVWWHEGQVFEVKETRKRKLGRAG